MLASIQCVFYVWLAEAFVTSSKNILTPSCSPPILFDKLLAGMLSLYLRRIAVQNRVTAWLRRSRKSGCVSGRFNFSILHTGCSFSVRRNLCGQNVSRRPYGELGSVDRGYCLCCVSVVSGFGEISPGCGCEPNIVDEIVNELTKRMRDRGDTAQIQRAEETVQRLSVVENKLVCFSCAHAVLIRLI